MDLPDQYPAPPANVPASLTETSRSFRAEVRNVIIAIIAFVLTYFILLAGAAALTWVCFKVGVFVMILHLHWITLLIGAGIMLMGGLVIFFLIKFLFASSGGTEDMGIEIREEEQPQLFGFIRRVVDEVGTHFPRRIFLTPDVNASVFYSSSFWSLFVPTRKSLNIGLGLVNSLNVSEFKAVLAHEFGHFSQKSMRLGSYVYYVNQVIFNMLYRNSSWVSAANGIASIHAIVYFFVKIAVYIVQGVQWVLRSMYGIINRQYLSLSREMEFHADTISASVSGSNNMAQALRQVELGAETYQETIQKCNEMLSGEQAPRNCYVGQRAIATHFAAVHKLPVHQGVPFVTRDFMEHRQHERVNFKNQWASHPTREEREASLRGIGLDAPVLRESAWSVFQNPADLQQQLTNFLYRNVDVKVKGVEDESFRKMIEEEKARRKLPGLYEGYFDGHALYTEKWAEAAAQAEPLSPEALQHLFEENLDEKIAALEQDIEVLNAIAEGRVDTKTFDFDGKKYSKQEAPDVRQILEKDMANTLEERNRRDTASIGAFFGRALEKGGGHAEALKTAYGALQEITTFRTAFLRHANEIVVTIHYLASNDFNLATDMVQRFKELHTYHEPQLRELFGKPPAPDLFPADLQEKIRTVFSGGPIDYYSYNQPHRTNLDKLREVLVEIGTFLGACAFERQKKVLVMQI